MTSSISYGFAVGRVRALETTLLDRVRYDRLVRAGGDSEFAAVLADTVYGRQMAGEGGKRSLTEIFDQAACDNLDFFRRYCLDEWVLQVLLLRRNINGLKVLLKRQSAGELVDAGCLPGGGDWTKSRLRALADADPKAVPAEAWEAVVRLRRSGVRRDDPVEIDIVMDRLVQELSLKLARPSRFLSGYLAVHADVENLRTFIRVRELESERQVAERAFLPGGTIEPCWLTAMLGDERETVASRFRFSRYQRLVEEGGGEIAGRSSALRLERLAHEEELRYLLRARYLTFGYEPLVCYYLFRENELVNLRQLHAAREAGLDEATCRELVAYAG